VELEGILYRWGSKLETAAGSDLYGVFGLLFIFLLEASPFFLWIFLFLIFGATLAVSFHRFSPKLLGVRVGF
jgi:hypothetical protein